MLGILALAIALTPYHPVISLVMTFLFGILGFTFYPLATALANSRVEQNERVGLSATILLTFGLGASIGPLIASTLMQWFGNNMLYGFMSACTLILFVRLRYVHSQQKVETNVTQDYIMATGDLVSSPLAAALDPRVDVESIQEHMTPSANLDESEHDLGADGVDDDIIDDNDSDEEQLAFSFDIEQAEPEAAQIDETDSNQVNLNKALT